MLYRSEPQKCYLPAYRLIQINTKGCKIATKAGQKNANLVLFTGLFVLFASFYRYWTTFCSTSRRSVITAGNYEIKFAGCSLLVPKGRLRD
jgi:hypothetical protein